VSVQSLFSCSLLCLLLLCLQPLQLRHVLLLLL
jgi:hypothetical protein